MASTKTRQERKEMVEWTDSEFPIAKQADLLILNRQILHISLFHFLLRR